MEFLLLVTLAGALAWLWNRLDRLERRVAELEGAAFYPAEEVRPAWDGPLVTPREAAPPLPEPFGEPRPLAAAWLASPPPVAEAVPEEPEVVEDAAAEAYRFRPGFDFEDVFGRLLPIWGGGVALAVAGFFLVRWSIELGMLTHSVRVALSFVFGTALLLAAELAYRFAHRVRDERVRQALAGAGLATLYASFYLAGSHYGLIAPGLAFVGLAAVTALAIALSFRFGLPSAVLGLVGGFAAPALAGSTDPNLPLLALYLALVTGGLTVTGRQQERPWLGLAALAAGLGWGALMLVTGPLGQDAVLAIGGYLVVIGALLPSLIGAGPLGQYGRIGAAGLATLQIAMLVDRSGYGLLAWGCYVLLGAAIALLGTRFVRLREAGAVAAALSACLLAAWPQAPDAGFAAIAAAMALIFAGMPLFHAWREQAGPVDWAQLALYPVALIAAGCIQLDVSPVASQHAPLALAALALAILPALAAWNAWPRRDQDFAPGPFAAFASAVVMTGLAGLLAGPDWSAPLVVAALAVPVFVLLRGRTDGLARGLQGGLALIGLVLLVATSDLYQAQRLFGDIAAEHEWFYAPRWLAAALPFGLLAASGGSRTVRGLGQVFAALLGYGAAAMLVPGAWLPAALAVAALGLAWRLPDCRSALVTLLALGTVWAAAPLWTWSTAGLAALAGQPVLVNALPSLVRALTYIAPLAAALGGALLVNAELFGPRRRIGWLAAGSLALVVLHVAFKQVFAVADMARFAELGLAERTLWQGLLALAALGLAAFAPKRLQARASTPLAAAALGHFALFGLLLENPLWTEQAVGGWPVANWLLPSYGLAIGLLAWLRTSLAEPVRQLRPMFAAAIMVLIALLALSELRQLFSGNLLLDPVGPQEDLLRSILAIALALGFLGWGAWSGQRSWRIGSLALMLLAVFKVFIFDASGLEGLARIASFFALGVCLIGIGWFYSRQLLGRERASAA